MSHLSTYPNWPAAWPYRPDTAPVSAATAMVATTDGYASEVGIAALRAGGNAVDAVIAVSFALAVVNLEAGNIGGRRIPGRAHGRGSGAGAGPPHDCA